MSRVLIWSPNYAPELTGIPPLVTDVAEWLVGRGHDVDVVTPMPNYPERRIYDGYTGRLRLSERRNGVSVHRSWLRVRPQERFRDKVLYELTASGFALPSVLRRYRSAEGVLCIVPTLMAGVAATALPRRPRTVLWIQDRVTLGAAALGLGPNRLRLLRGIAALEKAAVARANRVVVCSPGFRDDFVANGSDGSKIDVVYNWADLDWIRMTKAAPRNDRLRILYAGNLGYSQGFETIIEAARLAGPRVFVEIVGEGNAARSVERQAAAVTNVRVRPPVRREEFPALLAAQDAHLVVQRRVSAGANLPSKIATYLASGRPVVASIDPNTPAAQLLRESGAAVLVEPESPVELAVALIRLHEDSHLTEKLGARARAFAEARLGKESALERLEQILLAS